MNLHLRLKHNNKLMLSVIFLVLSSVSYADIQYIDIHQPIRKTAQPVIYANQPLKPEIKLNNISKLDNIINTNATKYELPPALIKAIIKQESNYNPLAVSSKGAKGLMQLMPATAAMYGRYDLFNPHHNVEVGSKHLSYLLKKYNKTYLALAAYNAGEGNVAKFKGVPPFKETRHYVYNILKSYDPLVDNTSNYRQKELINSGPTDIASLEQTNTKAKMANNRIKFITIQP